MEFELTIINREEEIMNAIEIVHLNEDEQSLNSAIIWDGEKHWHQDFAERIKSLETMGRLAESLIKRKAIPSVRLKYFTDPSLNVGGYGKSRKQIFEKNGTTGLKILRHPHFAEYLRYFISGPELPKAVIDGFCKIIKDDLGTSGMVRNQIRAYVRQAVRRHSLDRCSAADQFFKLALEIDRSDIAESVRSAALSVRH